MQRIIKFRGKRIDGGEWVEGSLITSTYRTWIKDHADKYTNPRLINASYADWRCVEVDPATVGQYTGLKDKNGKEIYEGDICSTDLSRPYLIVVFRNGAFMYQCHDDGKDYFDIMLPTEVETDTDKYTEVIGNIHDNPDLLEGGHP